MGRLAESRPDTEFKLEYCYRHEESSNKQNRGFSQLADTLKETDPREVVTLRFHQPPKKKPLLKRRK